MIEPQRLYYLDALGIDVFVPRYQLPNALPAEACPPWESEAEEAPAQAAANDVSQSREEAAEPAPIAAPPITPATPVTAPETNVAETSSPNDAPDNPMLSEPAAFRLAMYRIGDSTLVIDSRDSDALLPTDSLLLNIAAAVTGDGAKSVSKPEVIHWPVAPNRAAGKQAALDPSWAAASDMVTAFLEGRLAASSAQQLWVMGEAAYRVAVFLPSFAQQQQSPEPGEHFRQQLYSQQPIASLAVEALVLPSLSDILHDASLKPRVWQCVKPS